MENKLARFDHHPDPAIDFCTEVDVIEGMAKDAAIGLIGCDEVEKRVERAMDFTVGGDQHAIGAKERLREIERNIRPRQ